MDACRCSRTFRNDYKHPCGGVLHRKTRDGRRRDSGSNSLIFIARDAPETTYDEEPEQGRSRLAQALDTAVWLRDLKGHDDVKAARVLDVALARDELATPIDRARVLAARAELAIALGEVERARALRAELEATSLSDEERERFRDELQAADDLEQLMN